MFTLRQILELRHSNGRLYEEFLRVPAMSAGIYVLQPGQVDPQKPHREAELYFVARGKARFRNGDQDSAIEAGCILYVAAGVTHHFHSISEELVLLVVFAPAES